MTENDTCIFILRKVHDNSPVQHGNWKRLTKTITMKNEHLELVETLTKYFEDSLRNGLLKTEEASKKYIDVRTKFETYVTVICDYFMLERETMLKTNNTRREDYRQARQMLWFLCREGETHLGVSLDRIGKWSGGFDHATVRHGRAKIIDECEMEHSTRNVTTEICDILGYNLLKIGANYTTRKKRNQEMQINLGDVVKSDCKTCGFCVKKKLDHTSKGEL